MKSGLSCIKENVPLIDKNSFLIGGMAAYYCEPSGNTDIQAAVQWAGSEHVPLFILGRGTNLLISDRGWPGLVIHLSSAPDSPVTFSGKNIIMVPGGYPLNSLVKISVENGLAGMEELAGIPGTVGGAVVMNAGAFSQCIADTLESVLCCSIDSGALCTYSAKELGLNYRISRLKTSGEIVLSARFRFENGDPETLDMARKVILNRRKQKQPLSYPNCGSVFKRPPENFAGTLIEKCGLKGLKSGAAAVSRKHANFIINTGGATAEDVRRLIRMIQERVYNCFSILLEPEVIFIGEFDEPLFPR